MKSRVVVSAVIEKGDVYEYIAGKWDYFDTFKTCEKCADLRDSLMDVTCPALGDLRESYIEYLNEVGLVRYDEARDMYLYPDNHMNLNR